ncbi:MAG: outer membrane beta-barrel protein [Rikenellaceae bacterium]
MFFLTTHNTTQAARGTDGRGSLEIQIVESGTSEVRPIIGAIVELVPMESPESQIYLSTDVEGKISVPVLFYGRYKIDVTYLGYENYNTTFDLYVPALRLPTIYLSESSVMMDAVVKEVKMRASQSGDSLRYNASSYKVSEDADVSGLLQKMPGISIEDGEVTAQGETVQKVYVDGREFFGGDVNAAIKSLPAEVVDKIEVYDKLSDEAEYSGVDDGNSVKAINIVTKPGMREGIFGKLYAGGGYEPNPDQDIDKAKYLGGGSLNLFKGTSRITLVGLANNLNQQNFTFDDFVGSSEDSDTGDFTVRSLPGTADVNATGINFTDVYGKDDKLKVQGSLFVNKTVTDNYQNIVRWYNEFASTSVDSLHQHTTSVNDNLNLRFTGRIEYQMSKRSRLLIRPTLSYQNSDPFQSVEGWRYDTSNSNYDEEGVQRYGNSKDSHYSGYIAGLNLNYRYRFAKAGRVLTLSAALSKSEYESEVKTTTDPNYPNVYDSDTTFRYAITPSLNESANLSTIFSEKVSDKVTLTANFWETLKYQESDKDTYDTENDFVVVDIDDVWNRNYASSSTQTHKMGPGAALRFGGKIYISTGLFYQITSLDSESRKRSSSASGDTVQDFDKRYNNLVYTLNAKFKFNPSNTLRIYANSSTSNPSVSRFVDDTSSSTYVTAGNPDLEPTYTNRVTVRYIHTNSERGSSVMFSTTGTHSNNQISAHTILYPEPFMVDGELYDEVQQYKSWVNLDHNWVVSSNFTYGFPVDFLKSNLNLNASVRYSVTPTISGGEVVEMGVTTGGVETTTDQITYRAGATLGSNISENVDFTLSWSGSYSDAENYSASNDVTTKNISLNQTASAMMKFVFGGGFTFTGSVAYRQYVGISDNYDYDYILCNAYIGRKVLRNKRGEVNLGIYDIFNQNTSYNHWVNSTYTQNYTNLTLGRYVSLQFIYNLRVFGGKV